VSETTVDHPVHFLLMGSLADISFNPALPNGLNFEDSGIEIRLKAEDGFKPIVCRAYVTLSSSPEAHRFIAMQLERKFEPYAKMPISLPYVRNGRTEIEADGSMAEGFAIPFELYPPPVPSPM
jgi:hypothetical protein